MYTTHVRCTATEFRKNLFTALERASKGETLEILYKGSIIRLRPQQSGAKLSRVKRQHALLVDPAAIVESDPEAVSDMIAEAEHDWKAL
jgi:hypothetical protein